MNGKWLRLAVWTLPFLLTSALWLEGTGLFSFTAGAMYSVLAAGLGVVGLYAVEVEASGALTATWVVTLVKMPGGVKTLVAFAYGMLTLFGLNGWAVTPWVTDLSWLVAAAVCYLFTMFLTFIARSPIVSELEVSRSQSGIEYSVQVGMARLLTIGTAVPVAFALAVVVWSGQARNLAIAPSVSAPGVALLYAAMSSLGFARVLFRRASFASIPPAYRRAGLLLASVVLVLQALLEFIARGNWYLYTLSCITFLATSAVFSRSWAELSSSSHARKSNGLSTVAPTTG